VITSNYTFSQPWTLLIEQTPEIRSSGSSAAAGKKKTEGGAVTSQ